MRPLLTMVVGYHFAVTLLSWMGSGSILKLKNISAGEVIIFYIRDLVVAPEVNYIKITNVGFRSSSFTSQYVF